MEFIELVGPVSESDFFDKYWEKDILLCRAGAGQKDRFARILPPRDLDRVLTSYGLSHPDIKLVDAKRELTVVDYTMESGRIDPVRAFQQYTQGATIIYDQLHIMHDGMAALVRAVEHALNHPCQTNIYRTPKNAQGFKTHYDLHDVFVLQVSGSKHWNIYGTPIELPLVSQGFVPGAVDFGEVAREFVLEEGDMLYVPRGVVHDARSTGEPSIHITLGILAQRWLDVLNRSLVEMARRDVALRRSVPPGYALNDAAREQAILAMRNALDTFSANLDPRTELSEEAQSFVDTRAPLAPDQYDQVQAAETIGGETVLCLRHSCIFQTARTDEMIEIRAHGTTVSFPLEAATEVERILTGESFTPASLPGNVDLLGRRALVQRLIREGLVHIPSLSSYSNVSCA